jgi:hypothetical protein
MRHIIILHRKIVLQYGLLLDEIQINYRNNIDIK